jgi:hypothetical protein
VTNEQAIVAKKHWQSQWHPTPLTVCFELKEVLMRIGVMVILLLRSERSRTPNFLNTAPKGIGNVASRPARTKRTTQFCRFVQSLAMVDCWCRLVGDSNAQTIHLDAAVAHMDSHSLGLVK